MKRMKHVVLVVLDGAGAGYQPDADKYGWATSSSRSILRFRI